MVEIDEACPSDFNRFDELLNGTGKKFHELSAFERSELISEAFGLENTLLEVDQTLLSQLDKLSENVFSILPLPLSAIPNVVVNGRKFLLPAAIEEPSVIAGASAMVKLAAKNGGFEAFGGEPILPVQIHLSNVKDVNLAIQNLAEKKDKLISIANSITKRATKMVERGGGVKDFEVFTFEKHRDERIRKSIIIQLYVDVRNAMGANFVNAIGESLAPNLDPLLAEITSGNIEDFVFGERLMAILSNKCEERIVHVSAKFSFEDLTKKDKKGTIILPGSEVAEKIELANEMAKVNEHRAVTHNKGIMNGIQSIVLATGNDFRAVDAGVWAHSREKSTELIKRLLSNEETAESAGYYYGLQPLTEWKVDLRQKLLIGEIDVPIAVGIVGRPDANPITEKVLQILEKQGLEESKELAQLMAAIGLAQNLAALRSLVTTGINSNHLLFHDRGKKL